MIYGLYNINPGSNLQQVLVCIMPLFLILSLWWCWLPVSCMWCVVDVHICVCRWPHREVEGFVTAEILKRGRRVLTVRNTHLQHRAETLRRLATDLPCVCMHVRVSHCSFYPHQDPAAQLPADLVTRAYSIFAIILKYAVDMLTWEQADKLPAGLEPPYEQTHTAVFTAVGSLFSLWLLFVFRDRGDTYYCMLFNDEVHTYEQVIYTLQKAVNCSQKEAVSFATTVDRDVSTTFICNSAGVLLHTVGAKMIGASEQTARWVWDRVFEEATLLFSVCQQIPPVRGSSVNG